MRTAILGVVLAALVPIAAQGSGQHVWRISAYGGVASRRDTSAIFLHGHFHPDGAQVGISLDRDLVKSNSGFSLVGEAGVTRFIAKSRETTLELGLGARYSFEVLGDPLSVSAYTGPSWAAGAPAIATGSFHGSGIHFKVAPWLNYVSAEIAVGMAPDWNGVVRYYHRSGAFGLFEPNADEGSTVALGVQYAF